MNRRDLFRLAEELGWTCERRTKHGFRFRRGDQVASLPHTPSDVRSLTNFAADLRRRPTTQGGDHVTDDLLEARSDLGRYLNGDDAVPLADDDGTPTFIQALWDDLAPVPWPVPWPVPAAYADNRINGIREVPYGTYAWWVRRLQKTVDSVIP